KLKALSGGKLSINQFPGAQLGTEPQTLQKLRAGDIDFVITATANAASVAPQAGVFSLHFIFRDEDHLARALADKAVSDAFRAMIKDSTQGAQVLGLITMGFRNMYSKKEISKVDDIKGLKVRVQATKTEDTHFPAYGAQTVHMPFGEVYTSLQTGVVNVAENGVNVYEQNKHYEVAPVLNMTQHEANNNCLWVSDKAWNSFSADEKKWVQEAADEVSRREPAMAFKLEADSATKLQKIGVKINSSVDKSGLMVLCGVCIGGFTLCVFLDVVTRTIGYPWLWLQQATTAFFAWGVFVGIAAATRRNDHIYLAEITKRMTGTRRWAIETFNRLVVLVVAGFMVWFGYKNAMLDLGSFRMPWQIGRAA